MKKLIVNPPDRNAVKFMNQDVLIDAITETAFRQKKESFKPTVSKMEHLSRFVNHVEPKVVSVITFLDFRIESFQEARDFINKVGNYIYGSSDHKTPNPLWSLKLVKMEVDAERANNAVFGINLPSVTTLFDALIKEMGLSCEIQFNEPQITTVQTLDISSPSSNKKPTNNKKKEN